MSATPIDRLTHALLYEGHLLYPYRASALKNRLRFAFGTLYPPAACAGGAAASAMQTECLVRGTSPQIEVRVRFLQLADRTLERSVSAPLLSIEALAAQSVPVHFAFGDESEEPRLVGCLTLAAWPVGEHVHRLRARIENLTELAGERLDVLSDESLCRSFASTHTLLRVRDGSFVSLLEPPIELKEAAASCKNVGTWPVLVGSDGATDALLSSPIILYDYPRLAPESPGDLFDGTEIDEILSLRIATLTDDEKAEIRTTDPAAREILERTERLGEEELAALHGTVRKYSATAPTIAPGARVRLRPRAGADAFDVLLAGKEAIVERVEETFEDEVLLAVTISDDPGRDLGRAGQPGHRFYFRPDEVEPLP